MTQVDGSLELNASGDYIRRTTNLPSSQAYTFAGWVKFTSLRTTYRGIAVLDNGDTSAWNEAG